MAITTVLDRSAIAIATDPAGRPRATTTTARCADIIAPATVKIRNVTITGTGSTGGVVTPPSVSARRCAPYAQGLIKVRFYEMICLDGAVPYRYDFHIKPSLLGC